MEKSMFSMYFVRGQVTLTMAMTNNASCLHGQIAEILVFIVYNRVHSLMYLLLIFNCSIITYFIAVSLEKSPSFKILLHRINVNVYTVLNHMELNRLKEFLTLGVNNVLHHNLAQCIWLVYRELDALFYPYYYELLKKVCMVVSIYRQKWNFSNL